LALDGETEGRLIIPAAPEISYRGRVNILSATVAQFDWSEVSIIAALTGPCASISVLLQQNGWSPSNEYDVALDGKIQFTLSTSQSNSPVSYLLFSSLPSGGHTITLTKRTEALFEVATFHGFVANCQGSSSSPSSTSSSSPNIGLRQNPRRIEFLGDSISCGYGILGKPPCNFTPQTEDASLTYGALLSTTFNAELHLECWSGKGVVRNYGANSTRSPDPFPIYWNRTLANVPNILYRFSDFIPQAVVINLGTNDYSTNPQPPRDLFVPAYRAYLQAIRASYAPNTIVFFLVCGPLIGNPCCTYVQDVVREENSNNVVYVDLQNILNGNDYGCDGHPNVSGHAKMAAGTYPVIQKRMDW